LNETHFVLTAFFFGETIILHPVHGANFPGGVFAGMLAGGCLADERGTDQLSPAKVVAHAEAERTKQDLNGEEYGSERFHRALRYGFETHGQRECFSKVNRRLKKYRAPRDKSHFRKCAKSFGLGFKKRYFYPKFLSTLLKRWSLPAVDNLQVSILAGYQQPSPP
jgi:hypothetical protein